MQVCNCNEVDYTMILEAAKKVGFDLEKIQDETDAGTSCECCLEDDCDIVDLPLPQAIKKAQEELES